MGKQSNKPTPVSQQQYDKDLNSSLEILIEDGADDETLNLYIDDYKSRFTVAKPTPQKKNPNQSGDSNSDNGSSAFPKPKYGIDVAVEEANNPVSKRPQSPQKDKTKSFAEATKKPDVFKNEYETIDGEIKTLEETSTPTLTKGEKATILARSAKAKIDVNLSMERLQQEKEQSGFLNTLGQAGTAIWNVTGEALSAVNESMGGTEGYFTVDKYKPLQDQQKKYIDKAKRENLPLTPAAIEKGAEDIFIEEDQMQQFQKNLDAELPEGYDREGIWKDLKLENLKKNDALRQAVITADVYQNQREEFDNFKKSIENIPQDQLTKTQVDTYNDLLTDAKEADKGLNYLQESFPKILQEVKTSNELVDVFKYNYNDYTRALSNIKNFAKGTVAGTIKYTAEGLSYIDQQTDEPGKAPTSADKTLKKVLQVAKDISNEMLDEVRTEKEQFISYKAKDINNVGDFGSFITELGTNQLPIYLTLAVAPEMGSVLLGTWQAGDQFRNMEVEEMQPFAKQTSFGQKLLTSSIYGAAEWGFERLGTVNVIKNIERSIARASSGSRTLMRESVLSSLGRASKEFGYNSALEGSTEYLTAEAQIGADRYVAEKEVSRQQANENRSESFIGGAVMGGGMSIITGGLWGQIAYEAKLYSDSKDIQKTKDILSKVKEKSDELKNNPNLTKEEKESLHRDMADLANQSFDVVVRNAEKGKTFSKDENSFLVAVNLMQDGLKTEFENLKNSNFSPEQKKAKTEELNASFNQLEKNRNKTLKGEFSTIADSEKVFKREVPQENNLIDDVAPINNNPVNNEPINEEPLAPLNFDDAPIDNGPITPEPITPSPAAEVVTPQEPTDEDVLNDLGKDNEETPKETILEPITDQEYLDFVENDFLSDDRLTDLAVKVRENKDLNTFEKRIANKKEKEIASINKKVQDEVNEVNRKAEVDALSKIPAMEKDEFLEYTNTEKPTEQRLNAIAYKNANGIQLNNFEKEVYQDNKRAVNKINKDQNLQENLLDKIPNEQKQAVKGGQLTVAIKDNQLELYDAQGQPSTLSPKTKEKYFLEAIENGFMKRTEDIVYPDGITESEIDRFELENETDPSVILEKLQNTEINVDGAETSEFKDFAIASYINKIKEAGFLRFGDRNKRSRAIAANYFSQDGRHIDDLSGEISDKMGIEVTPEDIANFIIANPNGPKNVLYPKNPAYQNLIDRFVELTGFRPTPSQVMDFNKKEVAPAQIDLEFANEVEVNDETLEGIDLAKAAAEFDKWFLSLTPQEQVEFYFDLEEDYPNEYYQQRYNEQQQDEKSNEITSTGTPNGQGESKPDGGVGQNPQQIGQGSGNNNVPKRESGENKAEGELEFKTEYGAKLKGKLTNIKGFEDLDLIIVKNGMLTELYELASGRPLASSNELTEADAIDDIKSRFEGKVVSIAAKIYPKIYEGNLAVNPSPKYQVYENNRKQEEQKKAENREAKNLKYTEQERAQLQELLNQYEALPIVSGGGARGSLIPNAINEIKELLDRREGEEKVYDRSIDVLKESFAKNKAEIENYFGAVEEFKKGFKDLQAFNTFYEKSEGKKTPENADAELLKLYVEAHRKLVDSGIDWTNKSIRLGLIADEYGIIRYYNTLNSPGSKKYIPIREQELRTRIENVDKTISGTENQEADNKEQAETPKAEPKKSSRKVRDEKLGGKINDAVKDLLGGLGKLNIGINPEDLIKAAKVIALYIEAGIYKLSDIVEDLYERSGGISKELFNAIKSGYASFRENTDDETYSNLDSNTRDFTYEYFTNRLAVQEIRINPKQEFIAEIQNKLINKEKLNIVSIRKIAESFGLTDIKDTTLQEYVEMAIINEAKIIANTNLLTTREKYAKIIELYETQPTISMRSSERIEKQQYSTPIPMSFLAGQFVRDIAPKTILEPSAGNGMMIFNVEAKNVIANEIDKVRLENLKEQGFRQVTNQDGTMPFNVMVDGIVTNPPFGPAPKKDYLGYGVSGLDEQMVINALESMNDNGRASIVIGGHTSYNDNEGLKSQRAFLNYLYNYYNVTDIINIGGNLYQKQGTTFPTRMILIDGRKKPLVHNSENKIEFAPLRTDENSKIVTTFNELYERIETSKNKQNENILPPSAPIIDNIGEKGSGSEANTGVRNPTNPDQLSVPGDRAKPQPNASSPRPNGRKNGNSNQPAGPDLFSDEYGRDAGTNLGLEGEQGQSEGIAENTENGRTDDSTGGVSNVLPIQLSIKPNELGANAVEVDINSEKTAYPKQSKSTEIGSVVPTNMAQPLSNILSQFGDIDAFVQAKLGYKTQEDLFDALAAEQVDSVALAIYQMEKGKGLIIGDMTGVGKGRQAAAIIRYAILAGKKPIFFTEKPHLFSDLYRDLVDIGSSQLKPLIINQKSDKSDPTIIDANGKKIHSALSSAQIKNILEKGEVPPGYDYVMITYSQLSGNPTKGLSPKQKFFMQVAQNNIVVLDESHNAGGADSNTGLIIRETLPQTSGVTYLSGTFAKRPDNMPLYALKTSMSDANMSQEELIGAIQKGGVPLQEIMSNNLVKMGEMIRRERDFTGVTIDWETLDQNKEELEKIFDENIEIFNEIIEFQAEYINPIIEGLNVGLAEIQGGAKQKKGTKQFGISNVPFASKTFNLTRQLIFSLKAEDVAIETIKELKAGRKPVVAISSTMETFIKDLGGGNSIEGTTISNHNYSLSLRKGIDGLFRYTEVDFNGDEQQKELSVNDLSEEGRARYNEIVDRINNVSANISISPIDVIKTRIKQAGYTVGELTGRDGELIINSNGTATIVKRQDKDKKKLARDFNNGELDVLILNQSAATGISLHASKTFKDQRQRVMLNAQIQLDVNTEVQMRGRIDRTGQVVRGAYRYLVSPIPAEQRITMMFAGKLKSLDANTTSSQKSKTNDIEIVDFLNKYGDEIVLDYLKENREISEKLLDPLKFEGLSDESIDEIKPTEGDATKVSGRVALLSVKEQAEFYREIAERYNALINYLDSNNSNDLEITTLALNAETKSSVVIVAGNNNGSPFSEDSIRETVEVDVLKKPLKAKEISEEMEKVLDGKTNLEYKNANREKLTNFIEAENIKEEKTIRANAEKKLKTYESKVEKEADKQELTGQERNSFIAEKIKDYNFVTTFKVNEAKRRNENKKNAIASMFSSFNVGVTYLVPISADVSINTTYSQGMFLGYKMKDRLNPSNITAVFATLDSRRKVEVPFSKIDYLNTIVAQTSRSNSSTIDANLDNWDSKVPTGTRRTAYIITGNILQAFSVNQQGQLVSYTTKDGQIKQGILLPDNYKPEEQKMRVQIIKVIDKIRAGTPMVDASGEISISKRNGNYELDVPLSKARGGKYFLDDKLRDMIVGRDFKQLGQGMVGIVTENRLEDVLGYLSSVHNISVEIDTKPVQKKSDIINEPSEGYQENTTLALNTTKDGQNFLSLSEPGTEYSNSPQFNLQFEGDADRGNNNRRSVRAVWTKYKNIQFKGTTKISSPEDVARIMSLLENKTVEHAFAIHIDKDGNSNIQFISIGGITGTVVDARIVSAGVAKFNSVKVYLVHNHPSGKMQPSDADLQITKKLRDGFNPLGIVFEHIIMDTYLKEYVHIDNANLFTVNKRGENTFEQKLNPIELSEQEILGEHFGKVTSSDTAFSIIQNFRFSAMPKNAILVMNNSNQVIGNYVFSNGEVTYEEILKFVGETGIATGIILYGNQSNNLEQVKGFKRDLAKLDITLWDQIVTSSDNDAVRGYYKSMTDEGMLYEHQEQYGTGREKFQKYAEPVFVEGEGWAIKTLPNKYSPIGGVGLITFKTEEEALEKANAMSDIIAEKIRQKDSQVNEPASSYNKDLRLPQTIAREALTQWKEDLRNKVANDTKLSNAIDIVQNSDWYNNLDDVQKSRVNRTTIKSLLENAVKEINSLENKIEEYKQKLKDNKITTRQVFDDIVAFLQTNKIEGKITPTEVNRLIKSALQITTRRDTAKALDDFMKLYEIIKEKALLRSNKNAKEKAEVAYVVPMVESMVASGYDLQQVIDFFDTNSQKRMAEIQYHKEKSKYATEEDRVNKANEAIAKQKQDLFNATYTSFREGLKKARLYWFNMISDRSYVPANLMSKTGMQQTYYQFKNTKGYGYNAKEMYEEAHDKIWKGLTQNKIDLLHDFIQMMRIITIDNNREQNELGPVQHPSNLSNIDAQAWLDNQEDELGSKEFSNMQKRAKEYFKAYQAVLDIKLENGFITQETYDALNGLDYQPRMFLHHAVNFDGDLSFEQKQHIASRSGLSKEQVKSLEDGSAESLILDAQWLLSNSISTLYQDIADNTLNSLFIAKEFPIAKEKYDDLLTVPTDQLTKEEKRFIKYFKELSDKVIPNEVTGFSTSTNDPIYKNETPKSFVNKYYWADGVKQQFFMEENLALQFEQAQEGFLKSNAKEAVGNITGARLVKYFATGNNPLFVIVNTPRDFMWNILVSEHYSGFVPLAMAQMTYQLFPSTYDFIKTKLGRENTDMSLYMQHGGSMDYLHKQGDISTKSWAYNWIKKPVTSVLGKNMQPKVERYIDNNWLVKGVGALNEWSELAFRIATFRRSINAQLKELGFDNESEITDLIDENGIINQTQKEILDEIYRKATYDARSILDFSQGGRFVKDLEEFTPYLNVGVQAARSYADAMKKRPISTTLKTLQIAIGGVTGAMTLAMFLLAGDDDEPEEEKGKTAERKYIEFMIGVSEQTRSKYYIIPTKNRDEEGNRIFYKVAKDQMIIPYNNFVETLLENKIRTRAGFKEIEAKQIKERMFKDILENNLSAKTLKDVPLFKAGTAWYAGYDLYRNKPLDKYAKIEQLEGVNNPNVEDFYKYLGAEFKVSPIRTKYAIESMITSPQSNPYLATGYEVMDYAFTDKSMESLGGGVTEMLLKGLKNRTTGKSTEWTRTQNILSESQDERIILTLKEEAKRELFKHKGQEVVDGLITETEAIKDLQEQYKDDPNLYSYEDSFYSVIDKNELQSEMTSQMRMIIREKSPGARALLIEQIYGDINSPENAALKKELINNGVMNEATENYLKKKE